MQHQVSFLDFARELRNLVHNNGIYISKDSQDLTLVFNNQTYNFKHANKVNFAYAELLFEIYEKALLFIDELVACPYVEQMPVVIWS